jgi:hypothetical protein
MQVTFTLTARQVADLLRQIGPAKLTAKPAAKRPMTAHRREYQKLLMRRRRAAAKAA